MIKTLIAVSNINCSSPKPGLRSTGLETDIKEIFYITIILDFGLLWKQTLMYLSCVKPPLTYPFLQAAKHVYNTPQVEEVVRLR